MPVKIVGTSHISPESVSRVSKIILSRKPDLVAIELDAKRLFALSHRQKQGLSFKDIRRVGIKGWLFMLLGAWAERKLGKVVGTAPGSDMLAAVSAAREIGAPLALIDRDIELTLKRVSKALTWKEKWNFVVDVFNGVFLRRGIKFDLRKVPSARLIEDLLLETKNRYPNIYRVLVIERNEFMARQLSVLVAGNPDKSIIAVVGAGHVRTIGVLLKKYLKP